MTWRIDTHELSRIVKHDTVYWQGQKIYIGICNEKKKTTYKKRYQRTYKEELQGDKTLSLIKCRQGMATGVMNTSEESQALF